MLTRSSRRTVASISSSKRACMQIAKRKLLLEQRLKHLRGSWRRTTPRSVVLRERLRMARLRLLVYLPSCPRSRRTGSEDVLSHSPTCSNTFHPSKRISKSSLPDDNLLRSLTALTAVVCPPYAMRSPSSQCSPPKQFAGRVWRASASTIGISSSG